MATINRRVRKQRGFTLVELLLVVAILAVLGFLAIPRIVDSIQQARLRTDVANIQMIEEAINRFHADQVAKGASGTDQFPWAPDYTSGAVFPITNASGWIINDIASGTGVKTLFTTYFKSAPKCPFGTYYYQIVVTNVSGSNPTWNVTCTGGSH